MLKEILWKVWVEARGFFEGEFISFVGFFGEGGGLFWKV